MLKHFVNVNHNWMRVIGPLGTAGSVLLKLALFDYSFKKYGNPWPSQGRMAADMGISRSTFARAIKVLRDLGYVTIEKRANKKGVVEMFYRIDVPILELVDVDDVADDGDDVEAILDPAPVEKVENKTAEKDVLWEQFVRECPPALNPQAAKSLFKKMTQADCVKVLAALGPYIAIYNRAPKDKQRFFPGMKNWIKDGGYLSDSTVWYQRAGMTAPRKEDVRRVQELMEIFKFKTVLANPQDGSAEKPDELEPPSLD